MVPILDWQNAAPGKRPMIAILTRGDPATRLTATAATSRLSAVFEALAARDIAAEPVIYDETVAAEVRVQLLRADGVLVWVDPITDGRDRSALDPLLRDIASAGIRISAHPDIILKLGVKAVLFHTRSLGWVADIDFYPDFEDFRARMSQRLAGGGIRVLKQNRGNGGNGVWSVRLVAGPQDRPGADSWTPRKTPCVRAEMTILCVGPKEGFGMASQPGFFDLDDRYAALSKAGDPLERLVGVVNFEAFRYRLEKALNRSDRVKGGRPPYDCVLMFKILVLQALYGLSDDQAEFQVRDRLSFMRFLGIGVAGTVPDAKTIWLFRESLTEAGAIAKLFDLFDARLRQSGYLAMSGQIIDATLIPAPRQRNTEAEKAAIRDGRSAAEIWPEAPAKAVQKDTDARWTVKFTKVKIRPDGTMPMVDLAIPTFGYKNHVAIDRRCGLIRRWTVTDAARHDGARLPALVDKTNTAARVYADTAYRSKKNEAWLADNGMRSCIHRKKPRGRPMPRRTSRANAAKSAVRSAVEHVFARQKGPMAMFIRTIGIARATTKIGLANLAYNMQRLAWLNSKIAPA